MVVRSRARSLISSLLESLHKNRQSITVPPQDLDTVSTLVDKQKNISLANVSIEFSLNNGHQAIKAAAHVDILGIQIDARRSA